MLHVAGSLGTILKVLSKASLAISEAAPSCMRNYGIAHGLRIATSLNLSCVVVESDSAIALKFITQSCPTTHSSSSLIEKIKLQANHITHVYWNNVPRKANSTADQLAYDINR
ncbi:hypothetical protein Ahy_B06g081431 isoform B [Arachis hypogaea]|uniref:RNase H type-1 domain-containing protein n=1 Tax=Arachis hypogaea TaxID=3818 RepID=A0A444YL52_ARAHY|nr:hypothetical protein Ahy_B06g081431 isoform B [Arachis hypogaea]